MSEEFAREIEVNKILEFKPSFEDDSGIHEVVNNAIRNHVGRRQRFLEAYKKIQDQLEQHLGEIDPNPGRYEYKPDETEEQTGESLPVASMHRSVSTEQQGIPISDITKTVPVPHNAASAMTINAFGIRQIIPIKPNKVDAKSQRKKKINSCQKIE